MHVCAQTEGNKTIESGNVNVIKKDEKEGNKTVAAAADPAMTANADKLEKAKNAEKAVIANKTVSIKGEFYWAFNKKNHATNPRKVFANTTFEECQKKCLEAKTFKCISLDHYKSNCRLFDYRWKKSIQITGAKYAVRVVDIEPASDKGPI